MIYCAQKLVGKKAAAVGWRHNHNNDDVKHSRGAIKHTMRTFMASLFLINGGSCEADD